MHQNYSWLNQNVSNFVLHAHESKIITHISPLIVSITK